jgi:integrase
MSMPVPSLLDQRGQRKYLTQNEREAFLQAITKLPDVEHLYCATLLWTGCRPSEARLLRYEHLDLAENVIIIPTLKKRKSNVYRRVPVPDTFLLQLVIYCEAINADTSNKNLWAWGRTKAYEVVKEVLVKQGQGGSTAMPKTLRHTFGVHAIQKGIPVHLVQRWMGHAQASTTAIYMNVMGREERRFAERMWGDHY